ncbi:gamma-aminobutyrate permease [Phocicoccus schoeneichii]|uniref:Lysine-specific permease n=1 Tax=Phocicoccus schoeneichii TaxID=1812261 RepID=A0A6V7RCA1_9BACL|nr:amino acid permease [Jeotgalicoccus schoeneichii]GGH52553.1 gamma-aminobutyrate permease [Jeotgalicoccus schoeneichii]CAD2074525.1 Lysine-specific permease [Jeotgalicoccus schoeneichii]
MSNYKMERSLKTRHVSMIAIGGAIGTGLFVATGGVISQAGPGGAILAYAIIGVMLYFLMNAVGELSSAYPLSGAFSAFATRFIHPSFGFVLGWLYIAICILVASVDIVVTANVISFWEWSQFLSPLEWSIAFFLLIFLLNIFTVRAYGEAEYWLSFIKVFMIIVFVILGFLMIFGILGGHTYGFENFTYKEAPFVGGISGFVGVLLIAGFSVGGTEQVAITAGESEDPAKSMPKAVNQVFWRILLFYIGSIVVISAIIPYTDPLLLNESGSVLQSPFTIVFNRIGISFAASVINAVILTSLLSAANSMLYTTSRLFYSLAESGQAPKILAKINKKTRAPLISVIVTCAVILGVVIFANYNDGAVFYILNLLGALVLIIWFSNIWAMFRVRKAIKLQDKNIDEILPYKAKGYPYGQYIVIAILLFLFIGSGAANIIDYNPMGLVNHFLPYIVLVVIFLVHKWMTKSKLVDLNKVDLTQKDG